MSNRGCQINEVMTLGMMAIAKLGQQSFTGLYANFFPSNDSSRRSDIELETFFLVLLFALSAHIIQSLDLCEPTHFDVKVT